MSAKEYLRQIETLTIKIKQKEEQLESLRETAGGAAAIRYDKENVQISIASDIVERNVIRLIEMEEQVLTEKVRLESIKNTIIEQIHGLDDKRFIDVLYLRYVKCSKFEQIAIDLQYDYVYIRELHGEALGAFETRYSNILHNLTK